MSAYEFSIAFLATFYLLVALSYSARILGLRARNQRRLVAWGTRGSANWWHQTVFSAFRATILVVCLVRVPYPETIDRYAGTLTVSAPVILAGIVLLCLSFSWIGYVHAYMDRVWQSGVGTSTRPPLLTAGPYARSRNPMFIGILSGQIGFFLAWPSLFTATCLVVGATVIIRQAGVEEKALLSAFGSEYEAYRVRVPRWFRPVSKGGRRPQASPVETGVSSRPPHSVQDPS
ncbi:MAG: isoprenylcysteine carboxylmethyltransferase family protein [Pseudomonadota bacterium]